MQIQTNDKVFEKIEKGFHFLSTKKPGKKITVNGSEMSVSEATQVTIYPSRSKFYMMHNNVMHLQGDENLEAMLGFKAKEVYEGMAFPEPLNENQDAFIGFIVSGKIKKTQPKTEE